MQQISVYLFCILQLYQSISLLNLSDFSFYKHSFFVGAQSLGCLQLFAAPWPVAYQAPLSMGFFRQECWSRPPFPTLEHKVYPYNKSVTVQYMVVDHKCSVVWPISRAFSSCLPETLCPTLLSKLDYLCLNI